MANRCLFCVVTSRQTIVRFGIHLKEIVMCFWENSMKLVVFVSRQRKSNKSTTLGKISVHYFRRHVLLVKIMFMLINRKVQIHFYSISHLRMIAFGQPSCQTGIFFIINLEHEHNISQANKSPQSSLRLTKIIIHKHSLSQKKFLLTFKKGCMTLSDRRFKNRERIILLL